MSANAAPNGKGLSTEDGTIRGHQTRILEVSKGLRSREGDGTSISSKHALHDLEAHHELGASILTLTCLLKKIVENQQACTRSVVMSKLRRSPSH